MILVLEIVATLLVLLVAGALAARVLRARASLRGELAEASSLLDRMENMIRQDPYRHDLVAEYRRALEFVGPHLAADERARRLEFLRGVVPAAG